MPQLATSEVELVQGLLPSGNNGLSTRPISDHNASTIDFNSSSLPSTTSSKPGSSADNAISIASTPAAEASSEEVVSEPRSAQQSSRNGSPSSLSVAASDDGDDEDYAPWRTAEVGRINKRSKGATSDRKSAASSSKRKATNAGPHWEEEEDSLLVKTVDRLGTKWQDVSREFNRLSNTTRSYRAVEARWRILVLGDKGKAPVMPQHAMAASSRDTHSSASTRSRGQQAAKPGSWTKKELDTLRESLHRHRDVTNPYQVIYQDFFTAFPASSRTHSAIRNMCSKLLRGVYLPGQGGEDMDESGSCGRAKDGDESRSTTESERVASRPDEETEVSVIYMPSGLIIEDLPPQYHVKVYSPTHVKVGRKTAVDTAYPPAFHFKALNDGLIEAITLPEGTMKRVEEVTVDSGEGLHARSQTVYEGRDAYRVVFRGAVRAVETTQRGS